ncbi:hypothetical protein N7449_003756 [Penicillium cf. viridicatum]|uniref:Uncharacterized protein n=1 Tax=Penicillium cf. viridicatum TaxID=2972119 RepID=A0A9W9MXT9_9EURO|nr:hypothetical protein N7449_003756 [Penicillium cf. viridicatum]
MKFSLLVIWSITTIYRGVMDCLIPITNFNKTRYDPQRVVQITQQHIINLYTISLLSSLSFFCYSKCEPTKPTMVWSYTTPWTSNLGGLATLAIQ